MVVESEKQSAMQSPVSMATAKSDLFASYRNWLDLEKMARMLTWWMERKKISARRQEHTISHGGRHFNWVRGRKTNLPHVSHRTTFKLFSFSFKSTRHGFGGMKDGCLSVGQYVKLQCAFLLPKGWGFSMVNPPRSQGFIEFLKKCTLSGQMFLYINLVRISLYSNWE